MSAPSPVRAPSVPKRERRKEARPGELLEAALELFVEKGFAATRVEQVAARAGVSKGTLFLYYPTKEDLFKAVVRECISQHVNQGLRELAQFPGSTADLLREFFNRWWTAYGNTPASGLSKLMMSEATNFPELARFYQDEVVAPMGELMRGMLNRGIERGEFRPVDVTQAAHLLIAPLNFLVAWKHSLALCCPPTLAIDPEAFVNLHAELILRGLRMDLP